MSKKILGKSIYQDLREAVRPEITALIVVDMQNDFCAKGGHYDRCGKNVDYAAVMIPRLAELIRKGREAGVLVVYIQNTQLENGAYFSPATIAHHLKRWKDPSKICYTFEGTWGHRVVDDLSPEKDDMIVRKHRPSAFAGTDLDQVLRSAGKETIIVTGVITEGCVESTARDGWLRDYYVVIAEDCIASATPELHEAQLKLMKEIYHFVTPSDQIRSVWT
jgi:nicotinamidase-related amidase